MPVTLWESIASTPWWVFLIIGLLFHFTIKARHPHTISIHQLLILPVYLVFLGTLMAAFTMHPHANQYLTALGALTLGTAIGWLQFARLSPSVNHETRQIHLPGSYLPLAGLVAFFTAKFIIGFPLLPTIDPNTSLIATGRYNSSIFALYGATAGLAIGRYLFAKTALNRALS